MRQPDPGEHTEGHGGQREAEDIRQRSGDLANVRRSEREVHYD